MSIATPACVIHQGKSAIYYTLNTHITPDLLYFMTFSIQLQYAVILRRINVISNPAALQRVTADERTFGGKEHVTVIAAILHYNPGVFLTHCL